MYSLSNNLSLFALLTFLSIAVQAEPNIEYGKKIFKQSCSICHGKMGEKSALNQSKRINQLSLEEIVKALEERKAGKIVGAGNAAKSRLTEDDMKSIAKYLTTK